MRCRVLALGAGALLALRVPADVAAQEQIALAIEPPRAEIGFLYDGVRLTVSSVVDTGVAVAVLLSGPAGDLHLRAQARRWHVFWAPSGEVTVEDVPVVYMLSTSTALADLAPDSVLRRLGIGYQSIRRPVGVDGDGDLFPELIRLKESEGLFRLSVGTHRVGPATGGRRPVTAPLVVPAKAPAAEYRVQFFGFRDRRLVIRREGTFVLARGPFTAFAGSLAQRHGLFYGALAVVVAVGAGLLVGFVFGTAEGH